jgi:hexosaminidase
MKIRFAVLFFLMLIRGNAIPDIALIPLPRALTTQSGTFEWHAGAGITAPPDAAASVGLLRNYLGPLVGKATLVAPIVFQQKTTLSGEAYEIEITPHRVLLRAGASAGWNNAIQTLRELMPPDRLSSKSDATLSLPCVVIKDAPRFRWRGLMLDCSRHFFSKEFIERFIDVMALHKLNVFHWHLTDDQGWRLEIKKYPRLTDIGAWRGVGNDRYGGFYTQDDAREIVRYAAESGITVVPEIEMPGHAMAALAAYPELSCTGGPFQVSTNFGQEPPDVFCVGNENVYTFLDNVLTEVAQIFPSEFIHIGGDEVNKSLWHANADCQALMKAQGLKNEDELQSYFIRRVQKILTTKGKRLIGWDEILEGGLAPGATVMSWRGTGAGGLAAIKSNDDVIMSPQTPLYFDYSYSDNSVERVYGYNPVPPELSTEQTAHIIGLQGNIWTEHIPQPEDVEDWTYPRACALAEIAWSASEPRNYHDFWNRLNVHVKRLEALGFKCHDIGLSGGFFVTIASWKSGETTETATPREWDVTGKIIGGKINHLRFQYTGGANRLDIAGAELVANGIVVANDFHSGTTGGYDKNNIFTFQTPEFPPNAKIILRANIRSDGGKDSRGQIEVEQ